MQTLPYTATVAQGPKGEADVVMVALFLNELSFPPLRFTRVLCRLPPTILGTSTNWARLESASLRLQLSKEKERHSFIGCASFRSELTFYILSHIPNACAKQVQPPRHGSVFARCSERKVSGSTAPRKYMR